MNRQGSLALVRRRFTNLISTSKDIFRAEQCHQDAALRILYFDYSQDVGRDDFNLMEYLQRNIARDFYKHEGSLQCYENKIRLDLRSAWKNVFWPRKEKLNWMKAFRYLLFGKVLQYS